MDGIYLRHIEMTDMDRIHGWHSDVTLYGNLGGAFRYVSRAAEEEWIRKHSTYSRDEINLAICLKDTDEHIGNIYLRDIDWIARKAELHIFIGAEGNRGKGHGKDAIDSLLRHAFYDLGLQRVYLTVMATNGPAVKAYEKCGFEVEGRLRRHYYKEGEFVDAIIMGICACDFALDSQGAAIEPGVSNGSDGLRSL